MDRRRLMGVLLVIVSAASFGSGALFAKPVYAEGVGWLTLLAWRFGIAAALSWAWLLLDRGRRAGLRRIDRRQLIVFAGKGAKDRPSCPRASRPACSFMLRRLSVASSRRIEAPGAPESGFLSHWLANTRAPASSGSGSGCFRRGIP